MARSDTEPDILERILDGQEEPRRLELALLRTITDNFSDARIIGSGGCGAVYKGVLRNGTVAVKKLFKTHTIDEKMFDREVHSMMTVKHDNIVQFLGYCSDTQGESIEIGGKRFMGDVRERLLCFEHIKNGSLKNHIKDELRGLKWNERYQIIKGICEGLYHLHKEKCIRHMDLKPDNILLDDHLVPKITDFGLARLDDNTQTTSEHRLFTIGYCAPEYQFQGKMSAMSDIYSLGVIILELVTGCKEDPDIPKVLRRWRHRWNKSSEDAPLLWYRQVTKCLDLSQWCKQNNPISRPNIWEIISELNNVECWDGQIRYATVSTFDKIKSVLDDMLGIEPLEMHFPFALNEPISCSVRVTNGTDYYFAFRIVTTSLLPFTIQPEKGMVPPRSNLSATVKLQAQDKALPQNSCNQEFIVQSFRIDGIPTSMDVTKDMFDDVADIVVDEVNLTVVFDMPRTPEEPKIDMDSMKYQEAEIVSGEPHLRADNRSLAPSFEVPGGSRELTRPIVLDHQSPPRMASSFTIVMKTDIDESDSHASNRGPAPPALLGRTQLRPYPFRIHAPQGPGPSRETASLIDDWLPIISRRNAKWWHSAFHNVTAMVGAGVLSLPYAMSELGWGPGVAVMLLSWVITLYTLWQMVEMHECIPGKRFDRYRELGQHAFGERLGFWIVVPQQLIVEVGVCIVYMVTGGKSLQRFHAITFPDAAPLRTSYWIMIFGSAHVLLSQLPSFNYITLASLAAAVMSLSYSTIAWVASVHKGWHGDLNYGKTASTAAGQNLKLLSALGNVAFAYAGHNVVLEIQATIPSTPEKPSKLPMWLGVLVAYAVVAICYLPVAFIGYHVFGNTVDDNILVTLEKPRWLIAAANIFVVVHVIGSYQIFAMPVFDMLEEFLFIKLRFMPGLPLRLLARTSFVVFTALVGIAVPFFGELLGLFGGFAAPTTYFLPCILWLKVMKPKAYSFSWFTNWFCIIVGVLLTVFATIGGLRSLIVSASNYTFFS